MKVASVRQAERDPAFDWLDHVLDAVLHLDREGRVLYGNRAAVEQSGRDRADLVGSLAWALFPGADGTALTKAAQYAMESGLPVTQHASGPRDCRLEVRMLPLHDGLALYLRPVTDGALLQQQLAARNRQQSAIVHLGQFALASPHVDSLFDEAARQVAAVLQADCTGVLELQTASAEFVVRSGTGWKSGTVGRGRIRADPGAPAGHAVAAREAVVVPDLPADPRFGTSPLVAEHGWRSGMAVPVLSRQDPWGALCALCREPRPFTQDDVHFLEAVAHLLGAALDRSANERELQEYRDHLESVVAQRTQELSEALREQETFSYTVSHDLRTPLRAVGGFSDLLGTRYGHHLPREGQLLLNKVRAGARQMGELIEDLLALSRLGRSELARESVDLSRLAEEVLKALALRSPGRNVRWMVEPGLVAEAQPNLARILLENLLGNAWKYTSRTQDAHIRVSRSQVDGSCFVVADNGAGFDMKYAAKLFQPFQRLHAQADFEGTGIGLATVARIVRRHGGKVWAQGQPGEGAEIHFSFGPAQDAGTSSVQS